MMKIMKKAFAMFVAVFTLLATLCMIPVSAAGTVVAQLYGRIEDNGQAIYKMVLDYGNVKVSGVDKDTYTVHAKTSTEGKRPADETAYGDKDQDRTIVRVEEKGTKVEIYFDENDGAAGTLSYLATGARNIPVDIEYTVTQNTPVKVSAMDGTDLGEDTFVYSCTNTVEDEETAKFTSVKVDNGINYQYYDAGDADSLIVWFHGNGEGDYKGSQNNVAQLLANRGTVAWATDEAQEIFGKAHVMSFQAPDTWYYAQKDGLLEKAYNEIQDVISKKGIDPKKVYVSGCSAGGYMTTRMLIKYPNLFKAAMINCPALDVATKRGGETPTDEELASLKNSPTAIWLVQGATDGTVNTEDCSKRLFKALTDGQELVESRHEQALDSDFTTTETKDGKYKISLYDTTEAGKLQFGEDFDQDDVKTLVEFSNHWSWIYTLNNNPESADGTSIWKWAANYNVTDTSTKTDDKTDNTQKPSQPTTDKTTNSVKTGDNTVMSSYAIMMLLAAGAYTAIKKPAE